VLTSRNSTVRDAGNGAHERNRTADLLLTMQMLYRLSYVGSGAARGKIGCEQEPLPERAAPQGANKLENFGEQGKKSRPDPLLSEKGRRLVANRESYGSRKRVSIRNLGGRKGRPRGPKAKEQGPLGRLSDRPNWGKAYKLLRSSYFTPVDNCGEVEKWSGKRDSNPRPSAWKADALATELFPLELFYYECVPMGVEGEGFEPSKAKPADLQSAPFDRSGTPPARPFSTSTWSWRRDSNPQPPRYK
jgi:hypothetical protein